MVYIMIEKNKNDHPAPVWLCGNVFMGMASSFILSSGTVRNSITTLSHINTAPWWRARELASRATAWTGGSGGGLSTCKCEAIQLLIITKRWQMDKKSLLGVFQVGCLTTVYLIRSVPTVIDTITDNSQRTCWHTATIFTMELFFSAAPYWWDGWGRGRWS